MNLETPAGMSLSATRTESLKGLVAEIFAGLGVPAEAARLTAAALVAADVEGMSSHGVALVPTYVERMLAGSVSSETEPTVMHDAGSTIVLDACHILGPLSSDWTLPMASERAREHGLACVTVRNASHFGNAAFWARQIAEGGLIGIVMCNSHPSKAPPGGVERLTGANSLAIALPSTDSHPFVVELDPGGAPADAAAATAAMLVPGAAAKGSGLAAAIDLLCGGRSGPRSARSTARRRNPTAARTFSWRSTPRASASQHWASAWRATQRASAARATPTAWRASTPRAIASARAAPRAAANARSRPSCSRASRNAARKSASRGSCDWQARDPEREAAHPERALLAGDRGRGEGQDRVPLRHDRAARRRDHRRSRRHRGADAPGVREPEERRGGGRRRPGRCLPRRRVRAQHGALRGDPQGAPRILPCAGARLDHGGGDQDGAPRLPHRDQRHRRSSLKQGWTTFLYEYACPVLQPRRLLRARHRAHGRLLCPPARLHRERPRRDGHAARQSLVRVPDARPARASPDRAGERPARRARVQHHQPDLVPHGRLRRAARDVPRRPGRAGRDRDRAGVARQRAFGVLPRPGRQPHRALRRHAVVRRAAAAHSDGHVAAGRGAVAMGARQRAQAPRLHAGRGVARRSHG